MAQKTKVNITPLTVQDGMSSDIIFCTFQDSYGFIWFGTKAGLTRYDGRQFKVFDIFNTPQLSNNKIHAIVQDNEGLLWVGTEFGLTVMDVQGEVQKIYWSDSNNPKSISDNRIRNLHKGKDGTIWIGTDNGTVERYLGKDEFEIFYHFNNQDESSIYGGSITANFITFIAEDNLGQVWARDSRNNIVVIPSSLRTSESPLTGSQAPIDVKIIPELNAIGIDKARNIYGLDDSGLLQYDYADYSFKVIKPIPAPEFTEGNIVISESENFWIVDNKHCAEIEINSGQVFIHFEPYVSPFKYSRAKGIEDMTGTIWMTSDQGVIKIVPHKASGFTQIPSTLSLSIDTYSFNGMLESRNGGVVAHAADHMITVDPSTYQLDTLFELEGKCFELIEDEDSFWAIHEHDGLFKIDKQSYATVNYNLGFRTRYHTLLQISTGEVLIGTGTGVFSFDPVTEQFTRMYQEDRMLRVTRIYKMIQSRRGILWAVSSNGLLKLGADNTFINRYNPQNYQQSGLRSNVLVNLHEDQNEVLWLGGSSGGLIRFDPEQEQFHHYTKKDGLASNSVQAILSTDSLIWVSTSNGLSCFDPSTEVFKNYFKRDGLADNGFNINSALKTTSGQLFFGGPQGLTSFNTSQWIQYQKEKESEYHVPLILSSFTKLDGDKNEVKDLSTIARHNKMVALNYYDRNFSIEFALADFGYPEEYSYAYMLGGLDKGWNTLGNQTRINIPSLPYGNYMLRVKAKNASGLWSSEELVIGLRMNRIYYETPLFIGLVIFLLGLVVFLFFRMRLQRLEKAKLHLEQTVTERTKEILSQKNKIESDKETIEKQAEKLKEFNSVQTRWFTNIAHELRTPLTLILGPIRQFLKSNNNGSYEGISNITLAEKNSKSLLRLVNEILDVSKLESNQLKLNWQITDLTQLVKETASQFDSMARQKEVTLRIELNHDITAKIDKDRTQNILINLIYNALKFTHKGQSVSVRLEHDEHRGALVCVRDTGEGISKEDLPHIFDRYYQATNTNRMNQGGTGIGLALSQELAHLHGGEINVQSELGEGSTFTLSLPPGLIQSSEFIDEKESLTTISPGFELEIKEGNWQAQNNKAVEPSSHDSTILIVEDNPDMRQYIHGILSAHHQLVEAIDGLDALEYLENSQPDLIISDVMMPRMDGIELAKRVKQSEELKCIPFLTLTAKASDSDKLEALRIGIDDYLTKPFNAEELEIRASNLILNYQERLKSAQLDNTDTKEPSYHDQLIMDMKAFVLSELKNSEFTIEHLAESQNMSVSSLKRTLKKTAGMSPGKFVREIRLQQARAMLEARQYATVLEVVYAVGLENASHFSKLYYERFGKKPSEYQL
ncbi:hybrid sensor histidine kinase/response regulator transcription factor [Reichenbachiella ulvae]|uniref:histidine kinase n=1 Tax=Reichenbachiella ulvae TaxID=2980104 RepID=A0ABT3CQW4_9BACT|nr:ATP-binding protein [Reichenbachiella ulvae]MCV9385966.1 ATP-binding protein [Reichenbachiella ulvae]